MRKILSKIKNYKPSKYICYLYFFVPIFVCSIINVYKESDIWFLLNHGKYVLENGFPTIEPFTIHQNFSFVMQQWLSALIFYIAHSFLGTYGLKIILQIMNCIMLYLLYKLCMLLSDNKFRLSIICSSVTQTLLLAFFVPRPWIFTFLNLTITLYIMELYYKKNNKKALYFLLLISLLQINLQSSMWFMIFLFILPYLVCLFITKIKDKKDNRICRLLIIVIFMFIIGFINPYGLDNILYVFNSYGNEYINNIVIEMLPPVLGKLDSVQSIYSIFFYILLFIVIGIYILCKKGRVELRHIFLLLGVTILALINIRSISLFIIGTIPFLAAYLKPYFNELTKKENKYKLLPNEKKEYGMIIVVLIIYTSFFFFSVNIKYTYKIEDGIDAILNSYDRNEVILYTGYGYGSYAEYRGLKTYIDTRAEIFIKNINKKEDILEEYYLLCNGYIKYQDFVDKYNFTHMIINKNERIYIDACNDKNYRVIYEGKDYKVFEKMDK